MHGQRHLVAVAVELAEKGQAVALATQQQVLPHRTQRALVHLRQARQARPPRVT